MKESAIVPKGTEPDNFLDHAPDTNRLNSPEQSLLNGELRGRMTEALEALTSRERLVFELRHVQGLELPRAAGILRTSEAAAKTALCRATKKLRLRLADCYADSKG